MTESATPKGVDDASGKRAIDWEAIEREYRAGVLSIREIAARHGCTDAAVRKRAKRDGWQRDLTGKVQEAVRTALVRAEVRDSPGAREERARTEREIVEEAAHTVVDVVRSHRKDVRASHAIVRTLLAQLGDAADYRETLRDMVEDHAEERLAKGANPGTVGQERAMMMKMVALPAHAATARDLATALTKLIALERQAFNIDQTPDPDPPPEDTSPKPLNESDPAFAGFLIRLSEITGKPPVEPVSSPSAGQEPPKAPENPA